MRYVHRTLAASLLAVCATPPSSAAERFWSNPRGGLFSAESNWDDGVSGVPEEADTTLFDLDAEYEVNFFHFDAVTDRAIVRRGSVAFRQPIFSFEESYALLNRVSLTPGLVVGAADGDDPSLALIAHVDLRTAFTTLGEEAGAFGTINAQESSRFEIAEHLRIGDRGLGVYLLDGHL